MASKQPSTMVAVSGIAQAVTTLREKAGWSRLELAKRLGVSMTVLGVWETEQDGKAIYRGYNTPDSGQMRPFKTHRAFVHAFKQIYKDEMGDYPPINVIDSLAESTEN